MIILLANILPTYSYGGAVSADVQSANVVGYITYKTEAGKMDIFGAPFVNVGQSTMDIQEIKLGDGADQGGADVMMVFKPEIRDYDIFNWCSELYDKDWNPLGYAGWGDMNWQKQEYTLYPGQGFWLQTQGDVSVTVPGQVAAKDENETTTKAGKMDIYTSIYPVALDIQNCKLTDGADQGGADVMMVFKPDVRDYDIYNWCSELYDKDWNPLGYPGWGDMNWQKQERTLDPGQGFWLQTQADCTVEFTPPL